MYLLDTNAVSNYFDKRRSSPLLRARLTAEPIENIWISIVTVEEIIKGGLSDINLSHKSPRSAEKIVGAYKYFDALYKALMSFQILPYDESAEARFMLIPSEIRKSNTKDRYIAAIALSKGLTVVTSNTRHFVEVPGLKCVDWMLEESQ